MTMRWILGMGLMLAASMMLIATNATASPGSKLLNHCQTGDRSGVSSAIPFGTCLGYSSAVMEAMIANGRDERLKPKAMTDKTLRRGYLSGWEACFPEKMEPSDARNAARSFLVDHPDRLAEEAVDLVAEALASAYPCP